MKIWGFKGIERNKYSLLPIPFPSLKLPNKRREEYSKIILFISFHSIPFPPPKRGLKEEDMVNLTRLVSNEDISVGLWSLKAFKASGPDGLLVGFFQRFWLLVGDLVKNDVKQIFINGRIPEYLNLIIVTLIPKCGNPESVNHYCHISLCNMVYKIVSKIIIARIRPLLANLVSSLQIAFVPGRKGIDNVIIVQEIIHSMSKKRGRSGYMEIKIDLEKA